MCLLRNWLIYAPFRPRALALNGASLRGEQPHSPCFRPSTLRLRPLCCAPSSSSDAARSLCVRPCRADWVTPCTTFTFVLRSVGRFGFSEIVHTARWLRLQRLCLTNSSSCGADTAVSASFCRLQSRWRAHGVPQKSSSSTPQPTQFSRGALVLAAKCSGAAFLGIHTKYLFYITVLFT